jgi:hypothetical protein
MMDENKSINDSVISFLPRHLIIQSLAIQLLLFLPILSFFVLLGLGILEEPSQGGDLASRTIGEKHTILLLWIALFTSSAFFSCMGSLMSYLSRNRDIKNDIRNNSFVLSLHLVGSIFGVLMLLLFLGGFIDGNLFPSFDDAGYLRFYHTFTGIQNWAKLFVWTFIAGFSERLMPELLSNIAKRISPKTNSD